MNAPTIRSSNWLGDAAPETREQRCPACLGKRVTHAMRCGVKWEIECWKCKGTGVIAASPSEKLSDCDL